jgi:hypothetical protein
VDSAKTAKDVLPVIMSLGQPEEALERCLRWIDPKARLEIARPANVLEKIPNKLNAVKPA